jgi:ABC-type glycerol-3-phosphate transport system substrate-binding protein
MPTDTPRRTALLLALTAVTTLTVTACVGGAQDDGDGESLALGDEATLTVVSQFGDTPALQPVLETISDAWEQDHPEVTVDIQYLSYDDLQKTLPTALASGSAPDVFDYDASESTLGVLATNGLVHPLTAYAEQYGWLDALPESVVERATFDDTFYAVPRSSEAIGLFYDEGLFAQHGAPAPADYESFLAAAEALRQAGVVPIAFGNKDQWPSSHLVAAAVHAAVPVDEIVAVESLGGDGVYSAPAVQDAFEAARGWVSAGFVTPDFNGVSFDDSVKAFMNGQAGMLIEGTGVTPDLIATLGADSDVRFVPFPMIDASLEQQAAGGAGGSWAISASSPVADIAADWIDFVHFSDEAERLWLEAGVLPTTGYDGAGADVPALLRENLEVVRAANDGGGIGRWTAFSSSPLVTDAWNGGGQAYLAGDLDVAAFTGSLDAALVEARSGTP